MSLPLMKIESNTTVKKNLKGIMGEIIIPYNKNERKRLNLYTS